MQRLVNLVIEIAVVRFLIYCLKQGEASWTKPVVGGGSSINTSRSALTSARTSLDFAGDWVSYIDEETSQEYWYNTKTGETSWA